jgi:hypothetical protein
VTIISRPAAGTSTEPAPVPPGPAPGSSAGAKPAPAAQSAPTGPPRTRRGLRRLIRWQNVPERITGLTALIIVVAIVLGAVLAAIFGSVSAGVHLIGAQAAPEVQASTDLYFRLNDMDAQVANILLVGNRHDLGLSRQQAETVFQQDRAAADHDLQQAAAVAGAGPAAQAAVRSVLDRLGSYEALVGQISYLEAAGPSQPGRPPAAALTLYRTATDLLQDQILPSARQLTSANAAALDATYNAKRALALRGLIIVLIIGLALIALLIGAQFYISATHRRLLNPALATATLLGVILTGAGATLLGAQANHLYVAKSEAFDSILALSQARAISYDANADESRYLVDPGRASVYQQAFETESQKLARVSTPGIFHYDATLAKAVSAYRGDQARVRFGGFLGAEFRNITFPGERAAAEQTLYAYQVYERYDRRLRAMNEAGHLSAAIAFDTSVAPGNSNWAFYRYDQALVKLIRINQDGFTQAITASEHGTSGWTGAIPAIAILAVIILTFAGARARLVEYR